jgi:uncharacterized protein
MPKISESLKTAFFTVLFIFVFLYLFTKILGPIPFSVNSITTTKSDMFTVTGEGEAAAVPDTAKVILGVTKSYQTAEQAKQEADTIANGIIDAVKALGVDEKKIKTTNYNVNPNYDYSRGDQGTITGYTASVNVEVETETVDQANKVVDTAAAKGANQIGNVQFVLNDEQREQAEEKARADAIKKAKVKAQKIADAAGIKLGRIVNIQESGGAQPPVMFERLQANKAEDAVMQSAQLEPGENTVRMSVTLFYETL